MTFQDRILDKSKVELRKEFIKFIRMISDENNLTEDTIYTLWKEYEKQCNTFDQSPTLSEFIHRNKLRARTIVHQDGSWNYKGGAC